ncbi:MAG: DNA-binding protein [Bacillota bacterium]|nr:DNA-binding protein [Bacillota bacterium]
MRKVFKALVMSALLAVCFSSAAGATDTVRINDLVEKAKYFDGKQTTVKGEAIGEALGRGDFSWVNISDGSNAVGIWLSSADAAKISCFGDYKHVGDTLLITGMFSRDCAEHGGDVDIHCTSFEIVKKGREVKEPLSNKKIAAALILFFAASLLSFIYFKPKPRENKA